MYIRAAFFFSKNPSQALLGISIYILFDNIHIYICIYIYTLSTHLCYVGLARSEISPATW